MIQVGTVSKSVNVKVDIKIVKSYFNWITSYAVYTSYLLRILFYHLFFFSCILNIQFQNVSTFIHPSLSDHMANNPKYHLDPTYLYSSPLFSIVKYFERVLLLKVYISSLFVHSFQYNMKCSSPPPISFFQPLTSMLLKPKHILFILPLVFSVAFNFWKSVCFQYDTFLLFSTLWQQEVIIYFKFPIEVSFLCSLNGSVSLSLLQYCSVFSYIFFLGDSIYIHGFSITWKVIIFKYIF